MSELKEFIIGVDVSKKTLEIAILEKATQKVVGTKSFSNAPKGFSEMIVLARKKLTPKRVKNGITIKR